MIWAEIAQEIGSIPNNVEALRRCEEIRCENLANLASKTNRNVILYCSAYFHKLGCNDFALVHEHDMHSLMTTVNGLDTTKGLDIILQSPGGSLEVIEAIVTYLRGRFPKGFRIYIPHLAMSAAALWCTGADSLIMGAHSSLGPIDPQIRTNNGFCAAHAIITQYNNIERAAKQNPSMSAFYAGMLPAYSPGLIEISKNFTKLSKNLAAKWLKEYMFAGVKGAAKKAKDAAEFMGDHGNFDTHARHISREELREKGFKVDFLEADPEIQDLVLTVFHTATLTLQKTNSMKLVQNNLGVMHAI